MIGLKEFKENGVTWKVEQKMWDSVAEFGREFAIPPDGFTGNVKEWQSSLTDEQVVKNIQDNYPGLHPVIKTLAWDFRSATLKTIPNPGTLARIRSWLERQKEVVVAHAASQVPMKFCFCIILCEKKNPNIFTHLSRGQRLANSST